MTAPRLCTKDGCGAPVRARGLCPTHYQAWRKATPGVRMQIQTRKLVIGALPGRVTQVMARTGLEFKTVTRHLRAAHKDEEVHILGFDPPNVTGYKWMPVWYEGPGKNAVLTKKMKRAYDQQRQNANRAARRQPEAPRQATWLTALGVIPQA